MDEWERLEEEIRRCTRCPLHRYRRNPVPGEGKRDAEIMFVGEAPGAREDEEGRPFVGAAGRLLTQLIEEIGLRRSDTYITNIVKCRPPGNRDPREEEIRACLPYLRRQIRLVRPRILVALGRHAARTLFSEAGLEWRSMARQHGIPVEAVIEGVRLILFPTYHPAAALYNPGLRGSLEEDFRRIKKLLSKEERGPRTLLDYI
jgi:uracil-DNA glycosylase family 4